MNNKKFTDEEILKALECCYASTGDCENNCPMCDLENCNDVLMSGYVRDLIERQKTEIERLKGSAITNTIMESQRIKREAKTEAYKEFAEELTNILRNIPKWNVKKLNINNVGFSYDDVFFSIENLLKEKIKGDLKPQK